MASAQNFHIIEQDWRVVSVTIPRTWRPLQVNSHRSPVFHPPTVMRYSIQREEGKQRTEGVNLLEGLRVSEHELNLTGATVSSLAWVLLR
jgi:hypothetical protein